MAVSEPYGKPMPRPLRIRWNLKQSDLACRWPAIACYLRRHGLRIKDIVIRSEREVERLLKQVDRREIEKPSDQWTVDDRPWKNLAFANEHRSGAAG